MICAQGEPFIMPFEKGMNQRYNSSIFPDWSDFMFDKRLTGLCPESKKYIFIAPITLFFLFGFGGSWATATVLLVCVPLIPGAIMMVQKIAKKLLSKYWGQYAQLGSTFLEN